MSFITTNPNPYIVNVPELQGVLTSVTGTSNILTMLEYINTTTNGASFNFIASYNSGTITVTNDLYLSNASLYIDNSPVLVSNNTINGNGYSAFTVNNTETARITSNGIGIFTQSPAAALHVNGSAIFTSTIYVSSFGVPADPSVGNIIADGYVQASGFINPSDPGLKENIRPYISNKLPQVVEYTWKSNGARDIGVLADEMLTIEPACVKQLPNGMHGVDYAKLVVLCISEIQQLRTRIQELEARV